MVSKRSSKKKMSSLTIRLAADLQMDSIVDGEGLRTVIWTQGCSHACVGCHNKGTHEFDAGALVEVDFIKEELDQLVSQDGITLSGGDPFFQPVACKEIAHHAKEIGLSVWAYTGFTYEEIMKNKKQRELLEYIDVLVDGKFEKDKLTLDVPFKGSTNQRIIDVKRSIEKNTVVEQEKQDIKDNFIKVNREYMFV